MKVNIFGYDLPFKVRVEVWSSPLSLQKSRRISRRYFESENEMQEHLNSLTLEVGQEVLVYSVGRLMIVQERKATNEFY